MKDTGLELALAIWERRKWLAVAIFGISFSAVLSFVAFLPSLYQAKATVLVEREPLPDTGVQSTATGDIETRLQTINQQILSRERLKDLIRLFSLYPNLRQRASIEEVIEQMRRDIRMELKSAEETSGRRATFAFVLTYQGRHPQTVASVTNTLASFFIEENWKTRGRQATETAGFFKVQLDEMKKRLDEQESRIVEVKRRTPGDSPQQVAVNLTAMERLSAQLRFNMERLSRVMERRERLVGELQGVLPYGSLGEPSARGDRLRKLRQELAELRTRFTDQYPDVTRLRTEIAALERGQPEVSVDGRSGGEAESNPSVQRVKQALGEVEAEIKSIKAEERRLHDAITAYQRRVENMPVREGEPPQLLREYETTKDLYSSLLKRYADAQYAEDWEMLQRGDKFRIVDSAVPPNQPIAPNRLRLILMGLVLSLGMTAVGIMLAEQRDTSFHTVDDLRAFTKVPVRASIPSILTESDLTRREQRLRMAAAAAMVSLALIVGASYYIAHENEGMVRMLSRSQRL